jgi:hypothetical protein
VLDRDRLGARAKGMITCAGTCSDDNARGGGSSQRAANTVLRSWVVSPGMSSVDEGPTSPTTTAAIAPSGARTTREMPKLK